MQDRLEKNLDGALDSAIEQQRIVGGVVVVLRDGAPVYRRAVGLADREAQRPMQVDTLFRLASVTKPIVSVAALRLVEVGKLELDAPIARYLPEFRPKLREREVQPSVRQLLTHTAGLSYAHMQPANGPYARLGVSDGLDAPGLALNEELRRIAAAGLYYEPGTQWGYSLGIDVVGAAIERVTSLPLPAAIAELVTGPLDLKHTSFHATPEDLLATPYADGTPPVRMASRAHIRRTHRTPRSGLCSRAFSTCHGGHT